jgi:hypothetical protein
VPDRQEQRDRGAVARVVCTFIWGKKYGPEYAERLLAGVNRHLAPPHDFTIIRCDDDPLIRTPGCFARLRLFDPEWCAEHGFRPGDRVLVLDLDLIVTGDLAPLFEGDAPFRILSGVNSSNPCPYNGSVWRLDIGYRPDVWSDFSIEAAALAPHDQFPDDQAWFAHKMPAAAGFTAEDGVYAFQKPGWPRGEALPKDARIVAFPGWRDPAGFQHLDWVKEHWLT